VSVTDPTAVAPAVARAIVTSGGDLIHLSEVQHTLEDVYLRLIDEDVEVRG
jgi:ABC-2 type transport system ATP-binding protein